MGKQKHQNLVKRNVSFFAFCVLILLIAVIFSVPIKVEVHSVGGKPPFVFWFIRIISPIVAMLLFGLFLLVLFSAF
jgi:ABC-type proline/glycine betaine transport system permease subunit